MNYSEPRYTKDLDIWVEPSLRNSKAIFKALSEFGAPLANIEPDTFKEPGIIYICGAPPSRFDILTRIKGVDFDSAWQEKVAGYFAGVPTNFIGLEALITAKEAAGRPQDKLDLKKLRKTRSEAKKKPKAKR